MSDSTNEDLKCPERLQSFPGKKMEENKMFCSDGSTLGWKPTGFLPLSYFYSHAPRLPSNPWSLLNMNMLYVRVLWFSVLKGQDRTQDTVNESREIHLFLCSFFCPPPTPLPSLPSASSLHLGSNVRGLFNWANQSTLAHEVPFYFNIINLLNSTQQ